MQRKVEKRSRGCQHFWQLCKDAQLAESEVLARWKALCARDPEVAKESRNVMRFFSGAAIGPKTRNPVVRFCRTTLSIEVDDLEFDLPERFTDHVGRFAARNQFSEAVLDHVCGEYSLFRPQVDGSTNGIIFHEDGDYRHHPLSISQEGKSQRYAFEFRNGSEADAAAWKGYALCAGHYLYLTGFGADSLSMILTPIESLCSQSRVLGGAQLMKLKQKLKHSTCWTEKLAARPVVAVRHGPGFEGRVTAAKAWLTGQGTSPDAGLILPLRQVLAEEPDPEQDHARRERAPAE